MVVANYKLSESNPAVSDTVGVSPAMPLASGSAAAGAASQLAAGEEAAQKRRNVDGAKGPILPDCCNPYVLIRILLPLHALALVAAFTASSGWPGFIQRLLDIVIVMEAPLLGACVLVCAASKRVNGWPQLWQWMFGIGLPMALTGVVAAGVHPFVANQEGDAALLYWTFGRMLMAGVVAALVIEVMRLRTRAFSPSISEARLQALQARIRPHFLFNSLNTVLGLMRSDPRRAEQTLENLADLFRVFMKDTRSLVPLDEEVVLCQQYLAIEQLRLGERLRVRWKIDQMPGDALLPSLLLQPLIENAVHHGIEPRTEPGEIEITCTRPGDRVRVEVVNPVATQPNPRAGNQMALSNVRERLMLLYDMEGRLETSEQDGQFRLWLEIPYRQEKRRRDVRRNFDPHR